jgi:hypothetical protein
MRKAYDNVVSPANIAKTILDELKGFNLFNLLKHSWYLARIGVLLLICFLFLSVGCCATQRQLFGLRVGLHQEHLRNKKGGNVGSELQEAYENLT